MASACPPPLLEERKAQHSPADVLAALVVLFAEGDRAVHPEVLVEEGGGAEPLPVEGVDVVVLWAVGSVRGRSEGWRGSVQLTPIIIDAVTTITIRAYVCLACARRTASHLVQQQLLKHGLAGLPVLEEVAAREEACDAVARQVVDPPPFPQLHHDGVDPGVACAAPGGAARVSTYISAA